jgi:hypothetical protein
VLLEESFRTTGGDAQVDCNAEDTEETPYEAAASASEGVAYDCAQQYSFNLFLLASEIGLPGMSLDWDYEVRVGGKCCTRQAAGLHDILINV